MQEVIREKNSEVAALQQELQNMGFNIKVDGDLGPKTREALNIYETILENKPLAPIPWWRSSGMRGALVTVIGFLTLFVPPVKEALTGIDTQQLINILFSLTSNIEVIVQLIGALLAIFGVGAMAKGRIDATHPIDTHQVMPNIRLPFGSSDNNQLLNSNKNMPTANGESTDSYWSNYRGPFNEGH